MRDYGEESVTVWGGDPNCEHQWGKKIQGRDRSGLRLSGDHPRDCQCSYCKGEFKSELSSGYICQKCGAWKGQLGLEPTPDLFVKHLVTIFEKLKKPLKPWGTLYVVISDTYSGGNRAKGGSDIGSYDPKWENTKENTPDYPPNRMNPSFPSKCLMMVPERFAMAMIQNGWILRNKTIWHKPNAMPSSVRDRLNTTWEYVYMFAQRQKYWWNLDAIREPHKQSSLERDKQGYPESPMKGRYKMPGEDREEVSDRDEGFCHPKGKNPGDVQETKKISPQELIKAVYHRMDRDSKTYKGKNRLETDNTDKIEAYDGRKIRETAREILQERGIGKDPDLVEFIHDHFSHPKGKNPGDYWNITTKPFPEAHFAVYPPSLCKKPIKAGCPRKVCQRCGKPNIKKPDFKNIPVCRCDEPEWKNGIVLDPFAGAGSTWVMARKLGRDFIGIEIVEEYAEMARDRLPDSRIDKFVKVVP